jgi:hypothetical protein
MKINRKDVPKKVKEKRLQKGEVIVQQDGPVCVLKWSDKRNLTMISS